MQPIPQSNTIMSGHNIIGSGHIRVLAVSCDRSHVYGHKRGRTGQVRLGYIILVIFN